MRRFLLATTACLALGGLAGTARAQGEDIAMAIVLDSSDSVGQAGLGRLIDAHVALFNDNRLGTFLTNQRINSLAVSAFTFGTDGMGSFDIVRQLTSWQVIRNGTDATSFANSLSSAGASAFIGGRTPLGPAMWRALVGTATPAGVNLSTMQLETVVPGAPSFVALDQSGLTVSRVVMNIGSDGFEQNSSATFGRFSVTDAALAFEERFNLNPTSSQSLNVNAFGIVVGPDLPDDFTLRQAVDFVGGTTRSGGDPFYIELSPDINDTSAAAAGLREEILCQKFGLELVAGTPASNDCATLLNFIPPPVVTPPTIITVIQPGTTTTSSTIRQVVLVRVARVTDVAIPPATNTLSTTTETGRQTTLTLISEVTDTVANTITRTFDEDTIIAEDVDLRIEDLIPLRMPLEYGAVTRLGAALFGEMLENQPQRAQRLRGQVATRGPAAVRGDGAPSTAARPEGGIFAAAGLNDSLRYTATGQFAALPGFDFGWGEAPAGLDPAFTGSTGLWGRPFYSQARMAGGRGVDSYDHTHRGFALGADLRIGRYGLVGVWGGGSSANVGFAGPGGGAPSSASMSSWVGGVYGSAATGNPDTGLWYADVTLGYGEQDWTLNRVTLAGAPARGEFRSPALGAYTEAGFAGRWRGLQWQPHLFLRTVQTERPGLAESGAEEGVARQVDGASFTSVQAGPGLRVSQVVSLGDGLSLVPEGRLRWEREYGDNAAAVSGAFVFEGARVPFAGRAPGLDRDALGLGASLKLARLTGGPAGGGFGLDLDWDASVSNDTTAHRLALQLRLAW